MASARVPSLDLPCGPGPQGGSASLVRVETLGGGSKGNWMEPRCWSKVGVLLHSFTFTLTSQRQRSTCRALQVLDHQFSAIEPNSIWPACIQRPKASTQCRLRAFDMHWRQKPWPLFAQPKAPCPQLRWTLLPCTSVSLRPRASADIPTPCSRRRAQP